MRTDEPYAASRIVFTSWYYVSPRHYNWTDVSGRKVTYLDTDHEADDPNLRRENHSWGIRLNACKPVRSGPLFPAERLWENRGIGITTIIRDGNTYKAWGGSGWGDLKQDREYACYFESSDGLNWLRPDCGIIEYNGNKHNNLIEYCPGTVFIDPSAPPAERYKAIAHAPCAPAEYEAYCRSRPDALDPTAYRRKDLTLWATFGWLSPDGLHWNKIKEPLALNHSDTQIVACYDALLKKYVAYFRDLMVGPMAENAPDPVGMQWYFPCRRAISRAETNDFRKFPQPELIVEPGPELGPSDQIYTNCYTTIPGAPEQRLLFPAVWNTNDDSTRIKMMTSYNGKLWHDVPNGMILDTAEFGQWDGGCIFAIPNLIELPGGDFALPYVGYNVPHKYPRVKATRNCGYALWPKGRLCGLEAVDKGEFQTVAVVPSGSRLYINAVTKRAGSILVETGPLNKENNTIAGREFEHAVPLFGDLFKAPVVWKEHETIGVPPNDPAMPLSLRFKMDRTTIYGIEFK